MEVLVLVSTFIFTGKTAENSVCVNFCFKFLGVNWYMTVIIVLDSVNFGGNSVCNSNILSNVFVRGDENLKSMAL